MPTISDHEDEDLSSSEDENEIISLLSSKTKKRLKFSTSTSSHESETRARATFLALSLFLNLGIFWLLDSLKDPVFAVLVGDSDDSNENFEQNQPLAKMVSVLSTFVLVYVLEFFMHKSAPKSKEAQETEEWKNMQVASSQELNAKSNEGDAPAMSMISHIHIPYSILFVVGAILLERYPSFGYHTTSAFFAQDPSDIVENDTSKEQKLLGYVLYVAIESFGSLSVAAFWSYANSNLDLESAKKHYGLIIAAAQIGAILGSTIASFEFLTIPHMLLLSSALMICNMLLMIQYHKWYPIPLENLKYDDKDSLLKKKSLFSQSAFQTKQQNLSGATSSQSSDNPVVNGTKSKSGLLLILQHKYLLSILAVSCLYEVSLTCLDYEMKLVGLSRFNLSQQNSTFNFKTFMSRYGQLTNFLSLIFSFFGFPYWMKNYGVKYTLRLFPGFLVGLTIMTFTILPSNLWLLFYSMAVLKAMTYSINDPAKEILYMPTSAIIKVKAKFWIDVVGARFAKALGSSITNYAGSVDRLVKVGGVPSVLSSLLFLYFCIKVGEEFESLVHSGKIVGGEDEEKDGQNLKFDINLHDDDDDDDDHDHDYLVSMDPFTYKTKGLFESDPEGVYNKTDLATRGEE